MVDGSGHAIQSNTKQQASRSNAGLLHQCVALRATPDLIHILIHTLSSFIPQWCNELAKPGRGKPVLITVISRKSHLVITHW